MRVVLTIAVLSMLVLSGCSSKPDDVAQRSQVDEMYQLAQGMIRSARFSDAANVLRSINTRYPFGPYAQQVQLDLIYVEYKTGNQDRALTVIDRFLSLNPNHADNDYVRYMRGLVHLQAEGSFFQDAFGIDRSDRNPVYAERAFDDFAELIQRHPDSPYAADARARMVGIQARLAQHELAAAEYYLRREAYMAAANRGIYIIDNFPNVVEVKRALEIMIESYDALGLTNQASDARRVLAANF
ncbi:MAG: outer membrane protein assembly factor BamD [Aliidiomarina sp.]|uniref:outer membrane protein assembly factor BamD n=1 Tax=Aliidiomarina sp. TaxID=1872439 RepID=UPI0025C724EC|nr:outer membrane protein assembly factor BamD [Aliidiomarina sp.]MCH8501860.1 outer membrane protein assembly factor BamD [Aliidiomarina sp.]